MNTCATAQHLSLRHPQPLPRLRKASALALALFLLVPLSSPAATNYSDPEQLQTDAYVATAQADTALDAHNTADAVALYTDALNLYKTLASEFPTFKPSLVRYRLTYCQNQIIAAQEAANAPARDDDAEEEPSHASAAPATPPPTDAAQPPADPKSAVGRRSARANAEASMEADYLKNRIAALEKDLADSDTLIEELNAENAALNTTNQQLVNRLAKAQAELEARPDITASDLDALHTEIAALKAQLAAANADLDASREIHLALNDAEAQAAELHAKVADLAAENERLTTEAETLENAAINAQSEAGIAKARIAFLEKELVAAGKAVPPAFATPARASSSAASSPSRQAKPAAKAEPAARVPATPAATRNSGAPLLVADPVPAARAPDGAPTPTTLATASSGPAPTRRATVPPAQIPSDTTPAAFIRQLIADNDLQTALATVQAERKDAPDDETLALIEATALIRLEDYDDAAVVLIPFVQAHPKNADLHASLGAAMLGAGDYDQARETLETAVKLNKKLADAHYNLAQLYAFTDPIDLKAARKHYRSALDLGIAPDPALEAVQ